MDVSFRECSDCGKVLAGGGQPCGECGGTNVMVHMTPASAIIVGSGGLESITHGRNPKRLWQYHWRKVLHNLAVLEEDFKRKNWSDTNEVRYHFETFFIDCNQMPDWLGRDEAVPEEPTRRSRKFSWKDRDLRLCNAIANTAKHHTRNDEGLHAWVDGVTVSGDGDTLMKVVLAKDGDPVPNPTPLDALEVARRCVVAWSGFLEKHGLQPLS